MNKPELYHRNNNLQKRDSRKCLEEYASKIKWKKYGGTVIDIGSGDGSVTTILKSFIPKNYKALMGCDISEKMVQFANTHYARDSISFTMLDIESDLPYQLREKFDHAFSFYALHWIIHQEIAFSNIYDLLTKTGDCLMIFLGHSTVFDMYRELARNPRWSYWMKDVERFLSPYHDCEISRYKTIFNGLKLTVNNTPLFMDPENNIKRMMTTKGFANVEVKCVENVFVYTGREDFKNAMDSINPFKIPSEMQEDFKEDYVKFVCDAQLMDHKDDGLFNIKMIYKLITVYGNK